MKMPSSESDFQNYHQKYRNLKRKLKVLIYENECFQEELKKAQRKLLKVSRDKSFLLDRLLRYETVESSSSDSEATVSSDSDNEFRAELLTLKKKRTAVNAENQDANATNSAANNAQSGDMKKKKSRKTCLSKPGIPQNSSNALIEGLAISHGDGHMTSEEIERHLEAKQSLRDLIPEKTPLTVPAEMFSNEPSVMECEIIDGQVSDISPNNVVENVGIMIDIHE
ncbi:uncharacterized protein LOC118199596 [Stegodyphus dumicola]|uniref:uncharacterized protein LOC118199596 n=1 Tax=Stegodyphus dumicola TaxID=202533 RepID=UPI0015AA28FF|nr:uncharacterized protein LOC118199596 [Stegodyphus dumicola]